MDQRDQSKDQFTLPTLAFLLLSLPCEGKTSTSTTLVLVISRIKF